MNLDDKMHSKRIRIRTGFCNGGLCDFRKGKGYAVQHGTEIISAMKTHKVDCNHNALNKSDGRKTKKYILCMKQGRSPYSASYLYATPHEKLLKNNKMT